MRESLQGHDEQRWCVRLDSAGISQRASGAASTRVARSLTRIVRDGITIFVLIAASATSAAAQSPWERAASNLERTFTGPLARSLALVAIVIGGLMFMFGESGAKRQISGIVFGGGLSLFAAQFLIWLF